MTNYQTNAGFKYTIPVTKSQADEDGLYIWGEATGPEVDAQEERFDPSAIESFAAQIRERMAKGDPIPYYDEHEKDGGRGVLKHLGDIVDGEITDNGHLRVKVRLFEDNPAAMFLYRNVQSGKQYGMSVSGDVTSFGDDIVKSIGKRIRTFKGMILKHVANTTKPVWTPSLGTVLNRAVEKAFSEDEVKEISMSDKLQQVVDAAKPEGTVESTATEAPEAEAIVNTTVADKPDESNESTSALDAINGKLDAMAKAVLALAESIAQKPVETPEPATDKSESTETSATTVEKSLSDRLTDLEATLVEKSRKIEELESRSAVVTPPVVNKAAADEFNDIMKSMTPEERLRLAFRVTHEESK